MGELCNNFINRRHFCKIIGWGPAHAQLVFQELSLDFFVSVYSFLNCVFEKDKNACVSESYNGPKSAPSSFACCFDFYMGPLNNTKKNVKEQR